MVCLINCSLFLLFFDAGSKYIVIVAVSSNSAGFIAGRAVAGLCGAGVIGGTYTILALIVLPERIPVFYGLNGVIFAAASVSGHLVGGAFTSDVTWRW